MDTKTRAEKIHIEAVKLLVSIIGTSWDERHLKLVKDSITFQLDDAVREARAERDRLRADHSVALGVIDDLKADLEELEKTNAHLECRLKEYVEDYDEAVKNRWDACKDRDALKAELEALQESGNLVLKDRDLWKSKCENAERIIVDKLNPMISEWKSKAEKLAVALRRVDAEIGGMKIIITGNGYPTIQKTIREHTGITAALAEFDADPSMMKRALGIIQSPAQSSLARVQAIAKKAFEEVVVMKGPPLPSPDKEEVCDEGI